MQITVGIPRGMHYYDYFPLWEAFFQALGARVVTSPPTSKRIITTGASAAVDEACFPVKVYYGHVMELASRVDMLFLPRMVSVEARSYTCPKIMGLPDMILQNVAGLPRPMTVCVDLSKRYRDLYPGLVEASRPFTRNPLKVARAWKRGLGALRRFRALQMEGMDAARAIDVVSGASAGETPGGGAGSRGLRIAVLGHSYNVYDRGISMDLLGRLERMGAEVITTEMVAGELIEEQCARMPKQLFWTSGRRILGAAYHLLETASADGIIHLASFACGPDSMVGELMQRAAARRKTVPFMVLYLDEHSGEAGFVTRLEAFMDMVRRRRA